MLFVICAVFGLMLLVCQTMLSILGIGESQDLWEEEINPNSESDQETTCENELAEASSAADQGELCVETPKAGIASLRAIGTAITFFGLMGSAAESSRFATLPTIAIAFAAGLLAFLGVSVLFRLAAFQPYRTETKNRLDDLQEQDVDQSDQEFSGEETRI